MRNLLTFVSAQPLTVRVLIYLVVLGVIAWVSGVILAVLDSLPQIVVQSQATHEGYTAWRGVATPKREVRIVIPMEEGRR
jgi:hypothetical protein